MTEKRSEFPQTITLNVDSWFGTTVDGSNAEALHRGYALHMQQERQRTIDAVKVNKPKHLMILSAVIATISLILCFLVLPLGMMGLIGAGVCLLFSGRVKKSNQQRLTDIDAEYRAKMIAGNKRIDDIIEEWRQAKAIVEGYESGGTPNIVA